MLNRKQKKEIILSGVFDSNTDNLELIVRCDRVIQSSVNFNTESPIREGRNVLQKHDMAPKEITIISS